MFVPFAVLMMPLVKETAQLGIANRFGVIVLYVVFFMPMNVLLYSGYLNNIPMALEEAACVDGAGVWQTYWKIIFPNMKPMHATVAVLTAMSTWNDVMTPLVIMSGTDQNTLPLAQLNFQTQFGTNYNLAFASYLLHFYQILIFYIYLPEADYQWCCKRSSKIILEKDRKENDNGYQYKESDFYSSYKKQYLSDESGRAEYAYSHLLRKPYG